MKDIIPPKNPKEWQRAAKSHGVAGTKIHHHEFKSASKFQFPQYLSLRVLLIGQEHGAFNAEEFGLKAWVDEANGELDRYTSWKSYISTLTNRGKIPEGTFALVQFYQDQVMQTPDEKAFEFDVVSPVSKRTRAQERIREQELARDEELIQRGVSKLEVRSATPRRPTGPVNPVTPAKQIGPVNPRTPVNQITPISPSTPGRPSPPGSPGSEEYTEKEHPKSRDEQIVNTALIDFLNAFIIHLSGGLVQWTLHRKAFRASFSEESQYEARTDGYLEDKAHNIHAIVEVKPISRTRAPLTIAMQEAAQIVAWIMTNRGNKDTFTRGR